MYIRPSFPFRVILCPDLNIFVAPFTAVTAGMPYSRETTAPWDKIPPVSVINPPIFENTAVQPGSVFDATSISPASTVFSSSIGSHHPDDAGDHPGARRGAGHPGGISGDCHGIIELHPALKELRRELVPIFLELVDPGTGRRSARPLPFPPP